MAVLELDASEISYETLVAMAGVQDENYKIIEKNFPVLIHVKNQMIKLEGESQQVLDQVTGILNALLERVEHHKSADGQETLRLCHLAQMGQEVADVESAPVVKTRMGKLIYPKTENQKRLVEAFRNNDIVFASGVAGTGKTYLAVAYAVDQLKREKVSKIILTRPAVEAGESLGFLPGDMKEKVDPYLRPLYDALNEMLGMETVERYLEKEIIEIAPLAFMRGRTLNDAIVILDEAQNTTRAQMKMFLTRMGKRAKLIVNGDLSQTDLSFRRDSGLLQAQSILDGIDGIEIIHLDQSDVVRNPLVQKILERYEAAEEQAAAAREKKEAARHKQADSEL